VADNDETVGLPVRVVIDRTGLSADVLRAWERRYGVVRPRRSAGGQRLYSPEEVERLTLLRAATQAGHSIAEVANLDAAALESLTESSAPARADAADDEVSAVVQRAMDAAERLDGPAIESELRRAALLLGVRPVVDKVLGALLREIGNRWHRGEITPAHEHLASTAIRSVLAWAMGVYGPRKRSPRLLVATPAGELHEFGAMLAATAAAEEGWQVIYLGPNLPAKAIARAASQAEARAVAVSAVAQTGAGVLREIRALARALPSGVRLLTGGVALEKHAAALSRSGIRVLNDIPSFRRALRSLRSSGRIDETVEHAG
jgi:methylmalonyl-CoA mutase cobalamin-binding domain/chain